VQPVARFRSSDPGLDAVWSACERTLKMSMEDTFTDCPLYEQTLWIGDARNQALYAFNIYGDPAVSARSLELGAQSLERFPIVCCQVPSTWESLLPAWSFLWGMHVWEHYFHTGDRAFLEKIWPAARRNLEGAYGFLGRHGLFSGTFWNLLEWAPIDDAHPTVMHNSLLLVAATRAAESCAAALGDGSALDWLRPRRESLVEALNAWWDPDKCSFPDAILEDGTPSPKTCQHNSALAILADVLPAERLPDARAHLLDPPAEMTRISSPFAAQFLYEALDILGEYDAILASIRANYLPIIDAGATTVWETFPGSTCSPPGFPTRSHCHGWSCSPLQFFNRIVLGIRQTAPGGTEFEVSPWINGLSHASGAVATPHGPLHVSWLVNASDVTVEIHAPDNLISGRSGRRADARA
jgi:alpha-L-rhamnosidase